MKNSQPTTDQELDRFDAFLDELRSLGRRDKTLNAYACDWQQFSRWYAETNGEPFDLARLSSIDIQDYKSFLLSRGRSPATVNRRLIFLKRYSRFGAETGSVRQDLHAAFQKIQGVRRQSLAPKSLEIKQVRRLLKELELLGNVRDQAILSLFLYTGVRVGELVQLRKKDAEISERKGCLHIRAEIAKGGRERVAPLPLEARQRLQAYLGTRQDRYDSLFIGQRGPMKEDAIVRIVRKYAERCGIHVTPHLLRHTFAYQYLDRNQNDLVGLAAILGHESLNTTRLYTQKRLEDLQKSAERVGYF